MAEAASIKVEKLDASEVEHKIIELCTANPAGITDKLVQMHVTDVKMRAEAFNKLLGQGKIEILKQKNQLLYRLKDPESDK